LFELLQESGIDITLPSLTRHQVPQVADLGLTDTVDASEPLLDAVGVPGQIVVHHEVGTLQVDAFPGGVRGDQEDDILVLGEELLGLLALFPTDGAVDGDHCFGTPEQRAQAFGQVVDGCPCAR